MPLDTRNQPQGKEASRDDRTPQAPSISLPKGGGAIRGIGEKFAANPVTGTGSMTVPLATSPDRSGFGPQLSLSYDSGAGNGPFGFGWSLSLPSITRKTDKGLPRYDDDEESDVFILSGSEDLVPLLVEEDGQWRRKHEYRTLDDGVTYSISYYRPRIEGLFARNGQAGFILMDDFGFLQHLFDLVLDGSQLSGTAFDQLTHRAFAHLHPN